MLNVFVVHQDPVTPPPCIVSGRAQRFPCTPEGTNPKIPQETVPSHPDYYAKDVRHATRRADAKAYEQQNEPGNACWDACSALLTNMLCVQFFLVGVFDFEELLMLHRGHRNGLSSCRLGCRLGCHLGCRLGCHIGSRFGCTLG